MAFELRLKFDGEDQYLENYLYRINNDVDGGVDGNEKVADVGQHSHLRRPGV